MQTMTSGTARRVSEPERVDRFPGLLSQVQSRFQFGADRGPLFTTSTPPDRLWARYLEGFPKAERQEHDCRACRRFVERYGGLVTIDPDGRHESVLWTADAPTPYRKAVAALRATVERAVVTGVFVSSEAQLGDALNFSTKHNRNWQHFNVRWPVERRHRDRLLTAEQDHALKHEEYGMLQRGLAEYPAEVLESAVIVARSDALYRGEKILGPLNWLWKLKVALGSVPCARKSNLVWRAVASAPVGWAHVKSSVASTLLDDLKAGVPFETAKSTFAEKMHPLQYQRPTAPPKAGTVAQGEKIIETLGATRSLERRFARPLDVEALWSAASVPVRKKASGVFSHLLGPSSHPPLINGGPITWEKFERLHLDAATKLEVYAPANGGYTALTYAVHEDAPCLFQWGNHAAWYTYSNGSPSFQWNLRPQWNEVALVTAFPYMWEGAVDHGNQGKGVLLAIKGCMDTAPRGNALFPECLKSEYHGVRSVIEAYSRRARLNPAPYGAGVCGLTMRSGSREPLRVRVTSGKVTTEYTIDRWD